MNSSLTLENAIAPARRSHVRQTDKADRPYIEYLLRVMRRRPIVRAVEHTDIARLLDQPASETADGH